VGLGAVCNETLVALASLPSALLTRARPWRTSVWCALQLEQRLAERDACLQRSALAANPTATPYAPARPSSLRHGGSPASPGTSPATEDTYDGDSDGEGGDAQEQVRNRLCLRNMLCTRPYFGVTHRETRAL